MTRILVVDDDANLRLLYRQELEEEGYQVETVGSGPEALEHASQKPPDGVVLDIHMQGMDGLYVLRKLLQRQPRTAVVINSAYSHFKTNFASWSADEYVVKSSDTSELKDALRAAIARRSTVRPGARVARRSGA